MKVNIKFSKRVSGIYERRHLMESLSVRADSKKQALEIIKKVFKKYPKITITLERIEERKVSGAYVYKVYPIEKYQMVDGLLTVKKL
ncbi:MAG: hypothetical protein ACFFG0_20810 [Candidatus Thorarchaeota archaeon]